jgi:hypothetical protein
VTDFRTSDLPWDALEQAAFSGMMEGLLKGRALGAHERGEMAARQATKEVVHTLMGGGFVRKALTAEQVHLLRMEALKEFHARSK